MNGDPRSLAAFLSHGTGTHSAFRFDGIGVSRAQLEEQSDEATAWLAAQGIGKGDVIAVWLVNRLEWMALLFAAARLGSIVAAVNTRYRSADVAHVLRVSGAKLLCLEAGFRSIDFPAILAGVDKATVPDLLKLAIVGGGDVTTPWPSVRFDAFEKRYPPAPTPQPDFDLPVLLYTTSGTTSGPKLVAHSQATLAGHAISVSRALALSSEEHSLLAMLPFCGTFGMSAALGFLAAGAPIHVLDAFDAAAAFRVLTEHGITHTFGSDEMFRRILALTDAPRPFPRAQMFGFAAFEPGWRELAAAADARGMPLYGLYGSSELQALFSVGRAARPLPTGSNVAAGRCHLMRWCACAIPRWASSSHQGSPASSKSGRRRASSATFAIRKPRPRRSGRTGSFARVMSAGSVATARSSMRRAPATPCGSVGSS